MGQERRFERIFKLLASDHDNEYMMIDAHRGALISTRAAREKKRPKRSADRAVELTTKIHALRRRLGAIPSR